MLTFFGDAEPSAFVKMIQNRVKTLPGDIPWRWVKQSDHPSLLFPQAGEVVVCMGSGALESLKASGAVPKGRTITSLREKTFRYTPKDPDGNPLPAGHWMVTYSPGIMHADPMSADLIAWDIRLAHRFLETGSLKPVFGQYSYTTSLAGLLANAKKRFEETGTPTPVAADLETMGLFPYYPEKKIVTLQATSYEGAGLAVYLLDKHWSDPEAWDGLMREVHELLNAPYISLCGSNLKFDLVWILEKWGIRCTNFRFDTFIVGSLLNENRSNGLKWHAKEHTPLGGYDDEFDSKHDKSRMELVPRAALLPYAAGDVDASLRVRNVQHADLVQQGQLANFYVNLLHRALRAFEDVEHQGLAVCLEEYAKFEQYLEGVMHDAEQEALEIIPARLRTVYADKLTLGNGKLIQAYLFTDDRGLKIKPKMVTPSKKEPSTAAEHLAMFSTHPEAGPFIDALHTWMGARKMLTTYVTGFMKHLRPDGRFHPTYVLGNGDVYGDGKKSGGTVTGRLSAKDPAVQTIPKHTPDAKKLRRCFPAPKGFTMFEADFSQGELRVTACVANETTMLQAYQNGIDLHALTGAKLSDTPFEEFMSWKKLFDPDAKEQCAEFLRFGKYRQAAKAANFGLLYGMGAAGYQAYAKTAYGVDMTMGEAEQQRDDFFELYPGLVKWHGMYKAFAKKNGYVSNPLGRVRHLPLINSKDNEKRSQAERQSINSPIQSCLSDFTLWTISILNEQYRDEGLWIAGMTHDSVYGYFPTKSERNWPKIIRDTMASLPIKETFGWDHQIAFDADISVGPNLADLKELSHDEVENYLEAA